MDREHEDLDWVAEMTYLEVEQAKVVTRWRSINVLPERGEDGEMWVVIEEGCTDPFDKGPFAIYWDQGCWMSSSVSANMKYIRDRCTHCYRLPLVEGGE